jgi:hypothetical protein
MPTSNNLKPRFQIAAAIAQQRKPDGLTYVNRSPAMSFLDMAKQAGEEHLFQGTQAETSPQDTAASPTPSSSPQAPLPVQEPQTD